MKKLIVGIIAIFVLLGGSIKCYANTNEEIIKFDDGNLIVSVEKIENIEDGVEVFLSITNNREETFTFYKEPFYLLDKSQQDYSLFKDEETR